jgi:uncharacterized protein YcnI
MTLLGGGASAARAHVQVAPTVAAPNDAVKFTVLIPGERAPHWTKKVVLKVPIGVLPYSFEATPGWRRELFEASNGAVDRIAWSGRMAPDGFAEFSFLASTPGKPTTLAWKALQVYEDGVVVRWIGPPSSAEPAPVTVVEAGAPVQNAGGEGSAGSIASGAERAERESKGTDEGDSSDGLAIGLALAALLAAGAALVVAFRGRKQAT